MIRFEFGKILNRKIVYASIAFILITGIAMYIGRGTGAQVVLESEGNYLEGRAAVRLDKEIAARHGGPLTEERVEEILEAYRPDREDGGLWMVNNIYNTLSSLWGQTPGIGIQRRLAVFSGIGDVHDGIHRRSPGDCPVAGLFRGIWKRNRCADSHLTPWKKGVRLGESHCLLSLYPADGRRLAAASEPYVLEGFWP